MSNINLDETLTLDLPMKEAAWVYWLFCTLPPHIFDRSKESGKCLEVVRTRLQSSLKGLDELLSNILIDDYLRSIRDEQPAEQKEGDFLSFLR